MNTPAIFYVHSRLRGALTEKQSEAAEYISYRIGNPCVSLRDPMPIRIGHSAPVDIAPLAAVIASEAMHNVVGGRA